MGATEMSARAEAQRQIVEYLNEHYDYWDAPYGVLDSVTPTRQGGKVRTIGFGVAAYLDAEIYIWEPKRIVITARGPMASSVEGEYTSAKEVIDKLREVEHPGCEYGCPYGSPEHEARLVELERTGRW